ncbi:phosphatidylinositol-specific phospholipase C1-like protein [Chitinophaga japonensis]|nr:phosphatidylinositol-specific phospholipase C1-like protein [Chitinophaga japonensis]
MKLLSALLLLSLFMAPLPDKMDNLPLNNIQVIGSHNSYKKAIDPPLFRLISEKDSAAARHLDYEHISLSEQLSLGLGNLEIDIYADTLGGRYASPAGLQWCRQYGSPAPYDPDGRMQQPGFKVLHVQDIDFRSHCLTFRNCLQELKAWSAAHKDHYPVFITINAKSEAVDKPGFTVPEAFTSRVFDLLDQTILENLGRENLLTPDDVRGAYPTLEAAVLGGHWPTVGAAKGKFIFILDETGEKRAAYIQGHPSLKDRVLFANAAAGTPEAAFMIINDPLNDGDKIRAMVARGYIVRTRADANTEEARRNDASTFKAALQSGAQIITTDYYRPSTHFASPYVVRFDNGGYIRMNPLLARQQD